MPLALNNAVVKRTQMMKMWLRRRRPLVIIDETRTSHGKKSIVSLMRMLVQMTIRPRRKGLDVGNVREGQRLEATVKTSVQHWSPHATDVARKGIGCQAALIKDQDQRGPVGSRLKTQWLSDVYSLPRLLRMGHLCRLWKIASSNPLS